MKIVMARLTMPGRSAYFLLNAAILVVVVKLLFVKAWGLSAFGAHLLLVTIELIMYQSMLGPVHNKLGCALAVVMRPFSDPVLQHFAQKRGIAKTWYIRMD
jgi:predicted acyltransferase